MGLLDLLNSKRKKQFVSETNFSTNRSRQSHLAIATLVRLREVNVEEEDTLKVDYFFYADTIEKAQELTKALENFNYKVENKVDVNNKKLFIIQGQSTPIKMMHEVLRKWAVDMCELGYKYDCDFEGWEIKSV